MDGDITFSSNLIFSEDQLTRPILRLAECRLEIGAAAAFINFDDNAPPLAGIIEPFATMHDAWRADND